jgi:F-type H+-transporting ATPase subunit delta
MNHEATSNAHEFHADISAQRLAKVYAESLYAVAEKAGRVADVIGELDSLIDDVFKADPRLEVLLSSAAVGPAVRRTAIEKGFAGRAGDIFYNFLLVLNDHERLELLRAVRQAMHDLDDAKKGRLKVNVTTAVPLSAGAREDVARAVRDRVGSEPVLVAHVDPAILGGMKLRIGDRQIDASVRTRIDNLRHQILARSSHEIQTGRNRFSAD